MPFPLFAPRRPQPAGGPVASGGPGAPGRDDSAERPLAPRRTFHGYAREAAALVLLASALYAALALTSFQGDPLRPEVTGSDWVGPVGALCAGAGVETIGLVAWLFPVELALLAAPLLNGRPSIFSVARCAGDVVVMTTLAALAHVAFPTAVAFGAMPIGGSVGELFGEVLRMLFSTIGSYIIGLTVVALILIGRAAFSFIEWVKRLEQAAVALVERSAIGVRALAAAWTTARDIDRQRGEETRRTTELKIAHGSSSDAIIVALTDDESEREADGDGRVSRVPIAMASSGEALPILKDALAPAGLAKPRRGKRAAVAAEATAAPEPPRVIEHEDPPQRAPTIDDSAPIEPPTLLLAASDDVLTPSPILPVSLSPAKAMALDLRPPKAKEPARAALSASAQARAAVTPAPLTATENAAPTLKIVDTSAALVAVKAAPARVVPAIGAGFRLPLMDMLEPPTGDRIRIDEEQLKQMAQLLEKTLSDYGVSGKVEEIHPGPTVTTFEVSPAAGTKVSKVAGLADDLALGLSRKVRIVAPIPGKGRIGFEIPNEHRMPVNLRELIEDRRFQEMKAPLPCVLGRDIIGTPYFADLASMPHVIVAGATGAGKSVGLNVMLVSLLFRRTPAELRLLMIDPKVVELAPFDRIPHMLLPVVTDMKQAANALKWAVDEMERRYQLFANAGTKNITTYNGWVERVLRGEARPPKPPAKVSAVAADGTEVEVTAARDGTDAELPEKIPFIVIVVDEFADLMMQQGKDVEASVARLAQKARAAGMHVILATQRPSVDVITGMIKANFPTRIAFRVAQKVDSRTILDEQGAEHLLGRGDMLVKMNGSNDTRRVQCPFCSEEEVQRITDFLRLQGEPVYDEAILKPRDDDAEDVDTSDAEGDAMYDAAVRIVADTRRCSTSWIQRKLGVGYNRAAKIVEAMEKRGLVGPANGAKDREVLIGSI
jgi:S-DNA-T family DNA segregation ATPase FtsK/SpoIIIE